MKICLYSLVKNSWIEIQCSKLGSMSLQLYFHVLLCLQHIYSLLAIPSKSKKVEINNNNLPVSSFPPSYFLTLKNLIISAHGKTTLIEMTRKSEGIYFHTYGKISNNKKQNEFSYNNRNFLFLSTLTKKYKFH